jgi:membrane-bound metal-dependent hydrolase YbcI (DUF457 family)
VRLATHALISFLLARAFFAKQIASRGWPLLISILLAGTLADLDLLASLFGPSAYLAARNTATHSLLGTLVIIFLATLIFRALKKRAPEQNAPDKNKTAPLPVLLAALALAATLHLVLDFFSTAGVALLWPFRFTRYSTDWLPNIDPWLLVFLLAGLLLPELRRLITSEIGAKEKFPRGQTGARVAIVFIAFYVTARFLLHSSSLSLLESRIYHGESPGHIAALPDAFSPVLWTGIVETQSMLCTVLVPVAGKPFDPEAARCQHKPDISPALATAQQTEAAQKYLRATRFPRAFVLSVPDGTVVAFASMRDLAQGDPPHAVSAQVVFNAQSRIVSEQMVWTNSRTLAYLGTKVK